MTMLQHVIVTEAEWDRLQAENARLREHIEAALMYFDDPANVGINAAGMNESQRMSGVYAQLTAALTGGAS